MAAAEKDNQSVQIIDRTFQILEYVSKNGRVGLKDIYTHLGVNKASVFRIVNALCSNGYLNKDELSGDYTLSYKCYEVGINAVRNIDYIAFIRETLDTLSKNYDVISQYSIDDHNELLCLESYDSSSSNFSIYTRVLYRTPLYATSAGKAILSTYTDEQIAEKWKSMNVRVFTPNTITNLDDLMKDIYQIRQRGYATDKEETSLGLFCIGVPLLDSSRKAIGAISLSSNQMDDAKEASLYRALSAQTQRLSYMLSINSR